jgi:hypothetical protein
MEVISRYTNKPTVMGGLIVPNNVGMHGGIKWARTIDLHDVNVAL